MMVGPSSICDHDGCLRMLHHAHSRFVTARRKVRSYFQDLRPICHVQINLRLLCRFDGLTARPGRKLMLIGMRVDALTNFPVPTRRKAEFLFDAVVVAESKSGQRSGCAGVTEGSHQSRSAASHRIRCDRVRSRRSSFINAAEASSSRVIARRRFPGLSFGDS
ncbi:hypothetical protein IE81DRAFT_211718 [Ceraceosorus guamensis]|uniref:Uncharacterized protein n=1 Tax=Ceraceosorus guamensis TaxID=1522189 RepID=A0A316W6R9_9BASI|nr:hypothetical protein IE81DRAFT_211718 [Ceraceosorus guamensis]PWN45304.1 hypothetical protein IE81DRAFT_211718 [Ceraceosorus guamensis]